jgi:hypothetical protein
MRGKILIQQCCYLHPVHLRHQHGDVVYAFGIYRKLLGHVESLPQFLEVGSKMSEA